VTSAARSSLAEWARLRGFEPAAHHRLIINEIEVFLEGNDEVLLLFAPPGSAKSTYVSILLPAWYLANNPTHSILAATHNVEFAERWGRRVRNDIADNAPVLGIRLAEDSKAATRWSLESGGEYYTSIRVCDPPRGARSRPSPRSSRRRRRACRERGSDRNSRIRSTCCA